MRLFSSFVAIGAFLIAGCGTQRPLREMRRLHWSVHHIAQGVEDSLVIGSSHLQVNGLPERATRVHVLLPTDTVHLRKAERGWVGSRLRLRTEGSSMFDSVQVEWQVRGRLHSAPLPPPEAVTFEAAP